MGEERKGSGSLPANVHLFASHRPSPEVSEVKVNERNRERLCAVVQRAGEKILEYRGQITDTGTSQGHELSTIDEFARTAVSNALSELFPDSHYICRFELRPIGIKPYALKPAGRVDFYAAIDEVDGTTNTKREIANLKHGDKPRPQAATCIAICKDELLGSLQTSALFTYDSLDVYSAIRAGNSFLSFKNDILLREGDYSEILGDSKARLLLVAYSNTNTVEEERWKSVLKKEVAPTYEGCRASAVDIVNIIRGRSDAYIDARSLWGENSGARLQAFDIAAAIPIALGLGFIISDVYGDSWQKYSINDPIPLVVSRSERLHDKILKAVKPH